MNHQRRLIIGVGLWVAVHAGHVLVVGYPRRGGGSRWGGRGASGNAGAAWWSSYVNRMASRTASDGPAELVTGSKSTGTSESAERSGAAWRARPGPGSRPSRTKSPGSPPAKDNSV